MVQHDAVWLAEPLRFFARYPAARAPRFVACAAEIAQHLRPARE